MLIIAFLSESDIVSNAELRPTISNWQGLRYWRLII